MAKSETVTFTLKPIKPEHARVLTTLSKDRKYTKVLGRGIEENKKIAEAFSHSYPKACLIKDGNDEYVGIVVVEFAGNNNLETTLITDDKEIFTGVLIETVLEYKGKYQGMFITPLFPEQLVQVSLETRTKIAREMDFLDGRKSNEFKITL